MIHKTDALYWRLDLVFEGKRRMRNIGAFFHKEHEREYFVTQYELCTFWAYREFMINCDNALRV